MLCVAFFGCACSSVLTKYIAEMTFSLAYVLNVAFVALYHMNEIGKKAGREKSVRRGSLCNKRTRVASNSMLFS